MTTSTAIELAIEQSISEHDTKCKQELPSKFIMWRWLVPILIGAITVVAGATLWVSDRFGKVENRMTAIETSTKYVADRIDEAIKLKK
jgi:hypothetical protein